MLGVYIAVHQGYQPAAMGNALNFAYKNYIYNNKVYDAPDIGKKLVETFMTKRQQQRGLFLLKRVGFPVVGGLGALGGLAYYNYTLLNSAPIYHNYRIRSSYDSRLERHEQYLKENPKYLDALLTGYESLRPPADELPPAVDYPAYTREDRRAVENYTYESLRDITPRHIQTNSFGMID